MNQTAEPKREDRTLPREIARATGKKTQEIIPRSMIESKSAKQLCATDMNPISKKNVPVTQVQLQNLRNND